MFKQTKILIVDDEELNRDIIFEILEQADFCLAEAENGEQALAMLDSFRPDIILLDLMMPGIDGYTVCKTIRQDQRHKFIKIIMVTGKAHQKERLTGYEAGADDYLTKPFDEHELIAKAKVFARLKQAEEIDQTKTNILSLVSHETKTPLNGIMMGCQLLLNDNELTDKQKSRIILINAAAERLNDYFEKISFLHRLQSEIELVQSTIAISTLLTNQIKKAQQNAAVFIKFTPSPEEIHILADYSLLAIAFHAVLENAVQHTPENGTITIGCIPDKQSVRITVTDQGEGIAPERQEAVFKSFEVEDIKHHHRGSGLSLAICREIITQHGGTVTVRNHSYKGAVFEFELPMEPKPKIKKEIK